MSQAGDGFPVRRMIAGLAAGGGIGVLLVYGLRGSSPHELRAIVVLIGVLSFLGAAAGGFLKKSSWILFTGGVIGALVMGIAGVIATLHPKGLIYSIFGGPLGVVIVFLSGLNREGKDTSDNTSVSAPGSGVWDRELDG